MNNSRTITTSPATVEPKKSARLAQKRKLREEAGPSLADDDYYFSPYSYGKSSSVGYGKTSASTSQTSLPTASPSKSESTKGKHKMSPLSGKGQGGDNKSPPKRPVATVSESSGTSSPIFLAECLDDNVNKLKRPWPSEQLIFSSESAPRKASISLSSSGIVTVAPDLKLKVDEESMDEEKWLNALESGKLEELDEELKQIKSPTILTARQRAILEKRDKHYILFDEPEENGSKNKVMTEEMIALKAQKTERRRLLAQAKKESDQKKTVEKLLNKPYAKSGRNSTKVKGPRKLTGPVITYVFRKDVNYIVYPPNMEIPKRDTTVTACEPKVIVCGVTGCNNPKKYSCSKTGVPLCSLECYKKNQDFNFFTVTDSFDCESTMCETAEYESAIMDGEIFTELQQLQL